MTSLFDRIANALVWLVVLPASACSTARPPVVQDADAQIVTNRWLAAISKPYTPRYTDLTPEQINKAINAIPYRASDEWKPAVTDGDCEDYVIAKYHELSAQGMTGMKMRVVMLKKTGTAHAVLLARDGTGKWLVYDNRNPSGAPYALDHMRPDYQPVYDLDADTGAVTRL